MRNHIQRVLSQSTQSNGYLRCAICIGGKARHELVHRVVAKAFIENPKGLPQVNHKDGNKANNHASNLEWCDARGNQMHAIENGLVAIRRGSQRAFAKLTENDVREIRTLIEQRIPYTEIASRFGVCKSKICHIKQGKRWRHVI